MKALTWIVRVALFLVVLTFSVRNTDVVAVRWLPGLEAHAPLILVLLVAFMLGALFAWLVLLPSWLKAKRSSSVATKKLAKAEKVNNPSDSASNTTEALSLPMGTGHGI